MATHSSAPAWRIPWTGEPGGLPSMGSHRVGHDWSDLAAAAAALYQLELFNDGEGCLAKPQTPDPERNWVNLSLCVSVLAAQSCPPLWTPWTVASQAPASMEFSRQEYWSGVPFPSPEPELRDIVTKNLKCRKDELFMTSLFHVTFWKNIPLFLFFRFKRGQLNTWLMGCNFWKVGAAAYKGCPLP